MCKPPKPPKPKEPLKPQFMRNQYLDAFIGGMGAVQSIKSGRSSLRIPLGSESTRVPGTQLVPPAPAPTTPNPVRNPLRIGVSQGAGSRRTSPGFNTQ